MKRSTRTAAKPSDFNTMRFRSTQGPFSNSQWSREGAVEFQQFAHLAQALLHAVTEAQIDDPLPGSSTILRRYSANSENGPDASI